MNIIYLHTHDTGRYISPYGAPADTPNLLNMAREGLLFRNAYCAGPTCSPSRAALLTGEFPHQNGMWGLSHRGFSLYNPERHLAAFLRSRDYETALCGIQHETEESPRALGYGTILGNADYSMRNCKREWEEFDMGNARAAADFIEGAHEKPFFLSMGLFNTHRVYPALPADAEPQYVQLPAGTRDTPENREDMAAFYESARIADRAAGIVLDAVKRSGRDRDTIVFFTTDHGLALPGMKCTLRDTGMGVSLIIKYPEMKTAGKASDALVSHVDLFPTLCDLAGLSRPEWLRGKSLLPVLRGEAEDVNESVFAESCFHVAYEPQRCVRTKRYKYIKRFNEYPAGIACNNDDCPDKTLRIKTGFYSRTQPKEMLFDLVHDPFEGQNLAGDAEYAGVLKELRGELESWMEKTRDPLLKGTMIPPAGALVNYPGSLTPAEKIFIDDFSMLR